MQLVAAEVGARSLLMLLLVQRSLWVLDVLVMAEKICRSCQLILFTT